MRLVATPHHPDIVLLVIETETGEVTPIPSNPDQWNQASINPPDSPAWRRFGITWNHNELLVAARFNVLRFDGDLNYIDKIPDVLHGNPHQMVEQDGVVYVTHTRVNWVGAYDQGWLETKAYEEEGDSHFNSLLISDDQFWVLASRRGPSEAIEVKSGETRRLGQHCHNLGLWGGELAWCDTRGTGWLTTGKKSADTNHQGRFVRGLAIGEDRVFVGVSPHRESRFDCDGDSEIRVFDMEGMFVKAIALPGVGPLNDLRLIDEFDHAHLKEPFQ